MLKKNNETTTMHVCLSTCIKIPLISVFAQEEEDGDSLSLLMTNYNVLREKGQGLLLPK